MEKKYQVFVSSTYRDLIEERSRVVQALLQMDCVPSGMELFPAGNESQWPTIQKIVQNCDYYILISAGRYGSLHSSGQSYTELEYRYAESLEIPIAAFIVRDITALPSGRVESGARAKARLADFRSYVEGRVCKYWDNATDLSAVVSTSLYHLIKQNPREGWIRPSQQARDLSHQLNRIEQIESTLEIAIRCFALMPRGANSVIRALVTIANRDGTIRRTVCGVNTRQDPERRNGVPAEFGVAGHAYKSGSFTAQNLPKNHITGYPKEVQGLVWRELKSVVSMPLRNRKGKILGTLNFDSTSVLEKCPLGLPDTEKIVVATAKAIEPLAEELHDGQ